jgi:hypothetical protein
MDHKCIAMANEALAPHNTQIENIWEAGSSITAQFGIRTSKVDPSKRGKPKLLVATYCPLCGQCLRPAVKKKSK